MENYNSIYKFVRCNTTFIYMRYLINLISIIFITGGFLKIGNNFGVNTDKKHVSTSDTISLQQQPVTFAFLTDLHVSPGSASETSLHFLIDEINHTDIDFTVVTGDLSNSGSDAELLAVKSALNKLNKPCYVIPGNHETNWSESAGLTFNKLWGNDRFLFNHKGYTFIGFNTGPFMKMGDGFVKQEDLLWMRKQLQDQKLKNQVLISFSHYPLSDGLDNWVQVTDLLKEFGVKIDLCGHGHKLALFNFDGFPGIMGRAVASANSSKPGYNLVKLRNDSLIIFNKELSVPLGKPVIALNYRKPDAISVVPVSLKPDFSVNQEYINTKVIAEWSDSSSIFSGPCLVSDSILVYGNSLGWLKAISLSSKKIIWKEKLSGPIYSTPVAADEIIVLGTVDGYVIGFDAYKGTQLWKVGTGRPVLAEGIVEDGSVYIGGGDRKFYRINARTGKIVWQYDNIKGLVQGKPAISGSSVLFGAWDTNLYCLDKNTGLLKWKWNNGKSQILYSPGNIIPVCSGNKVIIVAPDRYMTAIDLITGKEIWRTGMHQVRESMGASPDGSIVYAKLMNDTIIAMSAFGNSPRTLWAANAGFGYEHNPCPVLATSDMVVNGTREGMLIAVDPKTYGIIWKFKAGNSSINKAIIDQNKIVWVTLSEGRVIGIKTIKNN